MKNFVCFDSEIVCAGLDVIGSLHSSHFTKERNTENRLMIINCHLKFTKLVVKISFVGFHVIGIKDRHIRIPF